VKVKATKGFGATVILHGKGGKLPNHHTIVNSRIAGFAEAYQKALEIAEAENRVFVHVFNDRDVIAGQGTVAVELLKQVRSAEISSKNVAKRIQNAYLDCVVVPVGGGGLIAGR
jgi:threonine dehydratase